MQSTTDNDGTMVTRLDMLLCNKTTTKRKVSTVCDLGHYGTLDGKS